MSRRARATGVAAGVAPVVGAVVAALALAGVAVFSVNTAGCDQTGGYVDRDGQLQLVGSCLAPADLPAAPHQPGGADTPADPLVKAP